MGIKTFTFRSIAFAHHVYAFKFMLANIDYSKTQDIRIKEMEVFGPRYITTWNLLIQTIYLFLALSLDISKYYIPESKAQLKFRAFVDKYKGYLYTVILFPTTLFVASMFWTLFWINRDWVLPATIEDVAPSWVNHCIHTNILLVIFLETILKKRDHPRPPFKTAVTILSVFGLVYFSQFMLTYYQLGRWIYGIYYELTWPQRISFIFLTHLISLGFLKVGFYIQDYKRSKLLKSQ